MRSLLFLCFLLSMQLSHSQTDTSIEQILNTETVDENLVYKPTDVDTKPNFPGGIEKFMKYVMNNFNATDQDFNAGRVIVTFIVEKDGRLSDIKAKKASDSTSVENLVKTLRSCPNWYPAKVKDQPVRCSYTIPFILSNP